jgi:RNA polymerase sigma-70 factor, ECF subfamily
MELITLVEHARQGDATAFSHLVTQHWRFVSTICLSQMGHAAEAEDLTQEVFVRVSHNLADLRAPDKFLPWLQQVTRNVCRMWRRRQRATSEPLDAIAEIDDPGAAARLRRSDLGEIVRAMLAQVSPMSREVLALHYLAGYSEAIERFLAIAQAHGFARGIGSAHAFIARAPLTIDDPFHLMAQAG